MIPPQVQQFNGTTHGAQESAILKITVLLSKTQLRNSQMEEMHRASYRGGWYGASTPVLGASPSQHLHVFNSQEVPQILLFKSFYQFHCVNMTD